MNPMERKDLEVIVDGTSIGYIKMKVNGRIIIVEGNDILPAGYYSHNPEQIKRMTHNKAKSIYPGRQVEVRAY